MNQFEPPNSASRGPAPPWPLWPWLAGGSLLVFLATWLVSRHETPPAAPADAPVTSARASSALPSSAAASAPRLSRPPAPPAVAGPPPEQVVASKVLQFVQNRRKVVEGLARHLKVTVPPEVERFFALAETGPFEELKKLYEGLKGLKSEGDGVDDLRSLWAPINETFGVAEEAHNWPAQQLLDYGHAILDSLRPGMVYVGGTDPGRYIPTLLNETSDGEKHVVLTQNAFADNSYLQYAGFLYGDRLASLTAEDSQRSFQNYLGDAQQRLLHDQQNPEAPRQIRPGEEVKLSDNRVQVSGQVAVMSINEKLMQTLMEKNPDASFAVEESFPFKSTYASAAPLGPVMELRASPDNQTAFTAERADQAVDFWRASSQHLLSDSTLSDDSDVRKAWSKLASSQAGLLQDRGFNAQAEQGFQIAAELCPSSPEAVFRYVNLLVQQNRAADAVQVAQAGLNAAPDNDQFRRLVDDLTQVAQRNRTTAGK
jgi:hypothetical protein